MAGAGFQVAKNNAAGAGQLEKVKSLASTQYAFGDMITTHPASGNKGCANKVAAADKATHIVQSMVTPDSLSQPATAFLTTAACEDLLCIPITGSRVIIKSYLIGDSVPPINGTACNSNSTATQLLVTAAGSANDYLDGVCYVPELGEQRLITADAVSTGVHTFTVSPAFRRAPTTGDTVIAVPFSKGASAVKFASTNPHQGIGTAVADKTGGQLYIEDVNLKGDNVGPYVLFSHPLHV